MPPAIYTQNVIAVIWDFDKTLTHGYMQDPLFQKFGVDPGTFWKEVNELSKHYEQADCRVAADTIYLNHILTYVRHGVFKDLTNEDLKALGADVELAPGVPEVFTRTKKLVEEHERFRAHEIKVEHYIVSTGLKAMIAGSKVASHVDGIWACELLPDAPPPGYLDQLPAPPGGVVSQIGYTIDNTSKTRAIFEINKGVGIAGSAVNVNSLIPDDQRRVPIKNMIYVADGPSDIPSFSVVNKMGGKTLGVYAPDLPGDGRNYENAAGLEEQGRVNSIAEANYEADSPADKWLGRAITRMATEISESRERVLNSRSSGPGHVV